MSGGTSSSARAGGGEAIALSIVIPAYNEAGRIGPTLSAIEAYAQRTGRRCEVLVIDDGSRDGTSAVVGEFQRRVGQGLAVRLLVNRRNRGKGYSVRRGMVQAAGEAVLMSDADGATPVEEVEKLLPWLPGESAWRGSPPSARAGDGAGGWGGCGASAGASGQPWGFDVVVGSRLVRDSAVYPPRSLKRRVLGALFVAIRRRLMLKGLRDTQCGFKLFSRSAARQIFPLMRTHGYAFDCEVLALAERLGYRVKETGIVWSQRDERLPTARASLRMLGDLFRIRRRLRRLDLAPEKSAEAATGALVGRRR